jgi:hypothetical protein
MFAAIAASYSGIVLVMGARMALRLCDVQRDTIANRALSELMHHYTVAEGKNRLVLTKKTGDMKLFLNDLDDLHQLHFVHHQQMVREIERLGVRSATIEQQRESWKVRALMAEAELLEATAKTSNNGGCRNVSDLRYASLKRYLAKRFHPDYGPGQGIEKIVETRSSRKSGTKLTVSIKESRDRLRRLDRHLSGLRQACAAVDLGQVCASRHAAQADGESSFRLGALRPQS